MGKAFDAGGDWGLTGQVNERLLDRMFADPHFAQPAPKSTCPERFSAGWVDAVLAAQCAAEPGEGRRIAAEDVQGTLFALTAESIARVVGARTTFICGGDNLSELINSWPDQMHPIWSCSLTRFFKTNRWMLMVTTELRR